MANIQNTYTGDGSTVLFSFTFPYLETSDIQVSVNNVLTTAYTLANATTVQFNTAPATGAAIRIYRQTGNNSLAGTFYPGSAIRAQDLNDNFTQILYSTQEVYGYAIQDIGSLQLTANWNFTYSPTGPAPTQNSHLATKQYVDQTAFNTTGIVDSNKGDITTTSSGTVWTLNNNAVVTAKLAASAVTTAKIADQSITSAKVAKTFTTTAVSKAVVADEFCLVTAGSVTLTLPSAPNNGDIIVVYNVGTVKTTTIARNGKLIMGLNEDLVMDVSNSTVTLTYTGATYGWRLT